MYTWTRKISTTRRRGPGGGGTSHVPYLLRGNKTETPGTRKSALYIMYGGRLRADRPGFAI